MVRVSIMAAASTRVGVCPNCREAIRERDVLIEYQTDSGRRMFAECPGCHDVIHPDPVDSPSQ